MSSSCQLLGHEEREPTSPAIPEEDIYEVKYKNRRTNVVRLLPNGYQERKLRKLADACAKLFNEVNYERRQQFFRGEKVDLQGTYKKYYEKYKDILGVNAQQVLNKNNEAWSSFFSLLKLKKQGKLPPHMNHAGIPGYWKESKKRKLILVVRQDRYEVDEQNHKLILKDFNLEIEFAGRLRWYGKQGRLEIYYDDTENDWYASIPVEVGVEVTKTGKKSKWIVHGERKSIQVETPKGNKVASIDLGINVLASVVVDDGTWLLYKGVRAKEDYFYLQRKIAEVQSLADKARNIGEYEAQEELNREKKRLFKKLTRRLLHLYRELASDLLKQLHDQGVSIIYLGYPFDIAQDKGNKFTVNLWSYRMLMNIIELKAQEYSMKVYEVVEYNTSKYCAHHDVEVSRNPRGVVSCPKGHKLHSDLNGALNILKKAIGTVVSTVRKPLSFLVLHNGVAPVKGCNP
ncbi:transposase [Candidatus Marsarchaeota G2 archaeon BE_D]|jgi:Transposase and inactivated derivatives|uniref:Transposase n=1 Tax=Candidatus Marsarchaeota G2 archaeon BE_D TaxID=1978158 RepID=A0A2R6BYU4_9ARCH|nr:MAG: transposase [Candidatus Marsarchaeota G2 archaeon BE_D]